MTRSEVTSLTTAIEAIERRLSAVERALAAPQWERPPEEGVVVPVERLKDAIAVCHGVSHHRDFQLQAVRGIDKLADDLAALIPEESPDA